MTSIPDRRPPVEIQWTWRRLFTYAVTVLNAAGVAAVIVRLSDARALTWLGLALIGSNVVTATLYLAGATVTDWARLAHAARDASER